MDNLRVLIIANDPLARAGLAALVADHPDCLLVGHIAASPNLPAETDIYRPDVLLWDLGWSPSATDVEQLAILTDVNIPTVALLPDNQYAADVRNAGIQGLLPRDANARKLLAALQAVLHGLTVIDPSLIEPVIPIPSTNIPPLTDPLTPRESEVLQLLAQGLPNKTIAHRLDISEHTVKFHVNAIMSKLTAQSRTEAVVKATQLGLILL